MPTPLDRALNSKNLFLGFAGIVTAVAAWGIWGQGDMFPREGDPTGDIMSSRLQEQIEDVSNPILNPKTWTIAELRRWLNTRGLLASENASKEELVERVKANLRNPPKT